MIARAISQLALESWMNISRNLTLSLIDTSDFTRQLRYHLSANSMIGSCISLLRRPINTQPCATLDDQSHKFSDNYWQNRVFENHKSIDFPLISTSITGPMHALNWVPLNFCILQLKMPDMEGATWDKIWIFLDTGKIPSHVPLLFVKQLPMSIK
jgi:hypothetical protein